MIEYAIFAALGFCIGVLSGFFGVGGAFVLTPTLNILGIPMAQAVATGLAFTVGVSIWGGVKHYLLDNMLIKVSLIVGFMTIIGLRLSYPIVLFLDEINAAGFYIRILYIIILLLLGILTLKKDEDNEKDVPENRGFSYWMRNLTPQIQITEEKSVSFWSLFFIAILVGFLQGIMGVGGGFILVPLFILVLDLNSHMAAGSSLGVIFISSTFGTYFYLVEGMVMTTVALSLLAGTFFGINIGIKAITNIKSSKLKSFYAVFLLLTSLGIIFKHFSLDNVSLTYTIILCFLATFIIILKYYLQVNIPMEGKIPIFKNF